MQPTVRASGAALLALPPPRRCRPAPERRPPRRSSWTAAGGGLAQWGTYRAGPSASLLPLQLTASWGNGAPFSPLLLPAVVGASSPVLPAGDNASDVPRYNASLYFFSQTVAPRIPAGSTNPDPLNQTLSLAAAAGQSVVSPSGAPLSVPVLLCEVTVSSGPNVNGSGTVYHTTQLKVLRAVNTHTP